MIINSKDNSYRVIQVLSEGDASHYLCRREDGKCPYHLVQLDRGRVGGQGIPFLIELEENEVFTDFVEYFLLDPWIYLVFVYPGGEPLSRVLEDDTCSVEIRLTLGQKILERFILMGIPTYLQWEVLEPDFLRVNEGGEVEFYYPMESVSCYGDIKPEDVWSRFALLLKKLLKPEEDGGLYPELAVFLADLADGTWQDIMEVYQNYLLLLPVFTQERKTEKEKKEPWPARLKNLGTKLLGTAKIVMGLGVLVSAIALLPGLWAEKVKPVLDAAALWKAVYVDGETLEEESEEEPETEKESESEDMDNGKVTRYWENGQFLYKGDMVDGLYEGTGTLYYADGVICYQGEFSFGKKEGDGSLFTEEGILQYEGGFHRDEYEGEGKLYGETGTLIYEGGFSRGKYHGTGMLFDPMTDFPVYDGTFRLGYYDGEGVEYDSEGSLRYEGGFLLGVYHGQGIYYDEVTGNVLMEGEFRNGIFVTPKEEEREIMLEEDTETGETDAEDTETDAEDTVQPVPQETREQTDTEQEKGPGIKQEGEQEDEGTQDAVVASQERGGNT